MVQEEYKVRVIKPNEGCKLTQATDVAIENRVISDAVYLAVNDVADNTGGIIRLVQLTNISK